MTSTPRISPTLIPVQRNHLITSTKLGERPRDDKLCFSIAGERASLNAVKLRFVARPQELPPVPERGRLALVDLAFANGEAFERVTKPLIDAAGERLSIWIDHHDHEVWPRYRDDPRFRLVSKVEARACPQLVDPEIVARAQPVEHLWAHADFDGCVAAAKFLLEGRSPYPEADEDARWADAPGHGFSVSERGRRLAWAMDEASVQLKSGPYIDLLFGIVRSLVDGQEPASLKRQLDELAAGQVQRQERLRETYFEGLTRPHPELLLLELGKNVEKSDKKFLLREMEKRARVAAIDEKGHFTVATFHDEGPRGIDLRQVPGLKGQRGFAWGKTSLEALLKALAPSL
jgi:hypothetical protein